MYKQKTQIRSNRVWGGEQLWFFYPGVKMLLAAELNMWGKWDNAISMLHASRQIYSFIRQTPLIPGLCHCLTRGCKTTSPSLAKQTACLGQKSRIIWNLHWENYRELAPCIYLLNIYIKILACLSVIWKWSIIKYLCGLHFILRCPCYSVITHLSTE